MRSFVDEIISARDPAWPVASKLADRIAEGNWTRYSMADLLDKKEKYADRQAIYMFCVEDPVSFDEIKRLVVINGTQMIERLFGEPGKLVRQMKLTVSRPSGTRGYKSRDDRWFKDVGALFEALEEYGLSMSREEVERKVEEEVQRHKFDPLKIGKADSLWKRRGGHLNGKYPMTKSLLQTGLMRKVVTMAFWNLGPEWESALISEYTRNLGVPPVWEQ